MPRKAAISTSISLRVLRTIATIRFRAHVSDALEIAINVILEKPVLAEWGLALIGPLNDRFGIAKMALLRAFDDRARPEDLRGAGAAGASGDYGDLY